MKHIVGLLKLEWMTGDDGRIAFWKVVTLSAGGFCAGLAVGAYRQGGLVPALPWLVTLAIVLLFASHSLKGLSVWAKAKLAPTVSGSTTVTGDLSQMIRAVREQRDFAKGVDDGPEVEKVS